MGTPINAKTEARREALRIVAAGRPHLEAQKMIDQAQVIANWLAPDEQVDEGKSDDIYAGSDQQ